MSLLDMKSLVYQRKTLYADRTLDLFLKGLKT